MFSRLGEVQDLYSKTVFNLVRLADAAFSSHDKAVHRVWPGLAQPKKQYYLEKRQ